MKLARQILSLIEGKMDTIGNAATTVGVHDDNYTVVLFHTTPVVKFNDEEIILNSGGWKTSSTRARMNQTSNQYDLGFVVRQERGDWIVYIDSRDQAILFTDGMTIPRS